MTPGTRTPCLTDEAIALLIEGEPRRTERRDWIAHLDRCGDCRALVADAAHCAEERWPRLEPDIASLEAQGAWGRLATRAGVAVALALVLVVGALMTGWSPFGDVSAPAPAPVPALTQSSAIASALAAAAGIAPDDADERWVPDDATRSLASALSESEIGFRMGLHLVDLEVSRDAGRADAVAEIRDELFALGRLSGAESGPDSLSGLAREAAVLGAWSEAGRLASARGHAPFFSSGAFRLARSELETMSFPRPVRAELEKVDALVGAGLGSVEAAETSRRLDALETAFEQLILLH